MVKEIIEVEIKRKLIRFRVEKKSIFAESDSYKLFDPETGEETKYFLKRIHETMRATDLDSIKLTKNISLQQKHLQAKHNFLTKLNIPVEPIVAFYSEPESNLNYKSFMITENVGLALYDYFELFGKDELITKDLLNNARNYFESYCEIIGKLHANKLSHNHPHRSNFTILNKKVFLIDIVELHRYNNLDWTSLKDIKTFFEFDYQIIARSLEAFAIFLNKLENKNTSLSDYNKEYLQLEGFIRIVNNYPVDIKMKYFLIAFLYNEFTPPGLSEGINPLLLKKNSYLNEQITLFKKNLPNSFPKTWIL